MHAFPMTRDLVLIGGGHAHALVLRMWGMAPLPGARVTLIDPAPVTAYTGMLPGYVAGHYAREDMLIDLVRLARHAGARLILGRALAIDRGAGLVQVEGRGPVAYDVASVDIGVTSGLPGVPGFADHVVGAKPMSIFAERWEAFVAAARPAPRVVVIGGGAGGVELALACAHRLRGAGTMPQVSLVERSGAVLGGMGAGARRALLAHLAAAGVAVLTGAAVTGVEPGAVVLADGRRVGSDFTIGAAGAEPQAWLGATGLKLEDGFLAVGPTLQTSDPVIFAAGDCAAMTHAPRPKAGVFAVRQAPVLEANLRAALGGGRMRAYHPQGDYLKLISTGGRGAVADRWGLRLDGPGLWRWKDRIDRAFLRRLTDLPAMPAAPLPALRATGVAEALGDRPLCGGCGAKVGAAGLRTALANLPAPARPEVVAGAGDDAAVLRSGAGFQVLSTDHLRAFTPDAALLARIAAVHALGDVWAMGARPQVALAQVILPRLSPALQDRTLTEIMAAAGAVFHAAGADIVGGHTSVGAELTLGFTVTGQALRVVTKAGARPGDALILTKPIGSGTVLAAGMAQARVPGVVLGEVVAAAWAAMARPQGAASRRLAPVAHAMTDVTGFGLAGHLIEMLDASGVAAVLELAAVPMLPGAEALAGAGHASSLAPGNRGIAARMAFADGPRAALLFDPQTAGGLLAAVPAGLADGLVAGLRDDGEQAAVIGRVVAGLPFLTVG